MSKKKKKLLCFCGSGKLFSDCHGNSDDLSLNDIKILLTSIKDREVCHYPDSSRCGSKIIYAHTITKSLQLKKISKDSYVYTFMPSTGHFINRLKGHLKSEPRKIPISQASTFTGFCAIHDNLVFAPIEKSPITFSDEQCFLIGYRALCMEVHHKKDMINFLTSILKYLTGKTLNGKPVDRGFIKERKKFIEEGFKDGMSLKRKYDKKILSGKFNDIGFYVVHFDKIPEIMCAGTITLEVDFNNTKLLNLACASRLPMITFSLISINSTGAAVFTWHKGHEYTAKKFLESFHNIPNEIKSNAVVEFSFKNIENIYFSMDWWDSLELADRKKIKRWSMQQMGLKYSKVNNHVNWNVDDIKNTLGL